MKLLPQAAHRPTTFTPVMEFPSIFATAAPADLAAAVRATQTPQAPLDRYATAVRAERLSTAAAMDAIATEGIGELQATYAAGVRGDALQREAITSEDLLRGRASRTSEAIVKLAGEHASVLERLNARPHHCGELRVRRSTAQQRLRPEPRSHVDRVWSVLGRRA